jgi:uncharacterized protein involved in exopolysaccharide biosynthesis
MPIHPHVAREEEGASSDTAWLRAQLTLGGRAISRNRGVFGLAFTVVLVCSVVALAIMPRTYHAETKILARRSPALAVHGDEPGSDAPTRAAADTILRRADLVALVERTELLQHWEDHRAIAVRIRDFLVRATGSERTEEDRLDAMVDRLQKRLSVWTNDTDGTVSVAIDWPDPVMATRLVDLAQQNFLDARYAQEISALAEHLSILQTHADAALGDVNAAVAAVAKLRQTSGESAERSATPAAGSRGTEGAVVASSPPRAEDPASVRLSAAVTAKQRSLDDLLDMRRRRVDELQTRLTELRATYTEQHPAVIEVQQALASLSTDSPQIVEMRRELAALKGEADRAAGARAPGAPPMSVVRLAPPAPPSSADLASLESDLREDRDPAMVYARGELRTAMDKYAALRDKAQAAQIDLETARAAFAYRYSVVTPSQLPKHPTKPNVLLVLLAALVAAFITATLSAVVAELQRGVVQDLDEVARWVGCPVLGVLDVPALPPGPPA